MPPSKNTTKTFTTLLVRAVVNEDTWLRVNSDRFCEVEHRGALKCCDVYSLRDALNAVIAELEDGQRKLGLMSTKPEGDDAAE